MLSHESVKGVCALHNSRPNQEVGNIVTTWIYPQLYKALQHQCSLWITFSQRTLIHQMLNTAALVLSSRLLALSDCRHYNPMVALQMQVNAVLKWCQRNSSAATRAITAAAFVLSTLIRGHDAQLPQLPWV